MARENQGLQIALIVFVMLTVVLGATAWYFFHEYSKSQAKATTLEGNLSTTSRELADMQRDCNDLKELITGQATADSVDVMKQKKQEDMSKYGGAYRPESQFYRPLVEKLYQSLQETNGELTLAKDDYKKLDAKYKQREASKQAQFDTLDHSKEKVARDLEKRTDELDERYKQFTRELEKRGEVFETILGKLETRIKTLDKKAGDLKKDFVDAQETVDKQKTTIEEITHLKVDKPDGKIRYADQKNDMVWINLGWADALKPLQTFAVYPDDCTDLTPELIKADIEVTRICNAHVAEARITRGDISDPILPGDLIGTPVWNPGEKMHFALAGLIDVNADGKSDLELIRNLITMNDGVVDAYQEDKGEDLGKIVGRLQINTRYLVLGKKPTERTNPHLTEFRSEMIKHAKRLGISTIPLGELMERMGFKRQAYVRHYGLEAGPEDFKARAEGDVRRTSSGPVSEIFKPRNPPSRRPGGAY